MDWLRLASILNITFGRHPSDLAETTEGAADKGARHASHMYHPLRRPWVALHAVLAFRYWQQQPEEIRRAMIAGFLARWHDEGLTP